jgi:hypothetical protein
LVASSIEPSAGFTDRPVMKGGLLGSTIGVLGEVELGLLALELCALVPPLGAPAAGFAG